MSSSPHSSASVRLAVLMFALVVIVSPGVRAVPDGTDDDLERVRNDYLEAQERASEQARRSAELERNLAYHNQRVSEARASVEEVSRKSQDVRARIVETQKLIEALQDQLDALHAANEEHAAEIREHKEQLVSFVRYVALHETVAHEAGPSAAGPIIRTFLQGSLSETVENALYNDALLKARTMFIVRLLALEEEGKTAVERLQAVALELGAELERLFALREELFTERDQIVMDFEEQVRTRALTEAELQTIKDTMEEAHARVFDAQRNLLEINDRLLRHAEQEYERRVLEQRQQLRAIEQERQDRIAEEARMRRVKEEADLAYDAMVREQNADRRQHVRVEEAKYTLSQMEARLRELDALLPDEPPEDDEERDAYRARHREREALLPKIAFQRETVSFMQRGYPDYLVIAYLEKRTAGQQADAALRRIQEEMRQLQTRFADTQYAIETLERDWIVEQKALKETASLARGFSWPVVGRRITAGFMQGSYQRYFGVPHRGIDIAVPQGSPVHAIADGVVLTVRDGGATGYTYVIIGHRDSYTSLYGHLLKTYVRPGDVVFHGHLIGLSGGQPGTPGAGLMTTGPHLHLEIHKNGQYIDPLTLLSL